MTVFCSVSIIVFGITFLTQATPGSITTSIGEDIATNNLSLTGAITSGSWLGSIIDIAHGGTGLDLSAILKGSIPFFSDTGTMSTLDPGTDGQVLTSGGAGADPSWSNVTRSATFVIAASDSAESSKKQADYVCDGTDDQVEIQAAIDALPASGGKVLLLEGVFIKNNADGIVLPSNTEIEMLNATTIKFADGINADASIFTNADKINGNTNISIREGTLEGNEENQISGSMYGVYFEKVTSSKIDCWIKGFRSYDAELLNCSGVELENRWFGNEYNKSETIYDGMYTISGNGSLTLDLPEPVDLRNKKITFLSNYFLTEIYLTPEDGVEFKVNSITYSGLPIVDTGYTVAPYYQKMEKAPDFTSENNDNAKYRNITRIRFHYFSSNPYQIGKVRLEPLPDKPIFTINFDDGGNEFYDSFAPVLAQYGYKGVVAYQSTYGDNVAKLKALYDNYGWDVISHTYDHAHMTAVSDEEAFREYALSRAWLDANGMTRASFIISAPYNEMNYARYHMALNVYEDMRGLSRYNYGTNLKTPWIQNYITDIAASVFRAKRTHSWEHEIFHRISDVSDLSNFCELLKSNSLGVVTFSDIYGSYRYENWRNSNKNIASGTSTITVGQTSVVVTHGLAATPTRVQLTPTTATGGKDYYISEKTATTFTITIDSTHTSDISFDWRATVGEGN